MQYKKIPTLSRPANQPPKTYTDGQENSVGSKGQKHVQINPEIKKKEAWESDEKPTLR